MATAVQNLILLVERLGAVGKTDDTFNATVQALKDQAATEETEIDALTSRIAALEQLPTFDSQPILDHLTKIDETLGGLQGAGSPDLTAVLDRLTALEDRNADDDAASDALPGIVADGGTVGSGVFGLSDAPLPEAFVGEAYSAQIGVSGGAGPYQFSILTGALPDGLVLAPGGAISGTPTTAGILTVTIQAHDANSAMASEVYAIDVDEAPEEEPPEPVVNPDAGDQLGDASAAQ